MSTSYAVDADKSGTTRGLRTGGRSARVLQNILSSALVELTEVGYSNVSVARIAHRAGVHATTIYRRWPRREDLMAAACMRYADEALPVPDTGSLAGDLKITLHNLCTLLGTPTGQALITLAFSSRSVPEFAKASADFWHTRMDLGQRVFEQAAARNEWPSNYDKATTFGLFIGPVLARYFLLQEQITDSMIESHIASVLSSLRPA
jgi:AcrR family transcriptional regulator